MIAALALAAVAAVLPVAQAPDVAVVLVSEVAWHTPGAAVGAYAPGTGCPDVDCTAAHLQEAFGPLTDARDRTLAEALKSVPTARVVVVSLPSARGHLGGVAVYPGSGLLDGSPPEPGLLSMADVRDYVDGRLLVTSPGTGRDLDALDRREHQRRLAKGWFLAGLIAFPVLLYIWLRFGRRRAGPGERRIALALGAYPAAGFLASALPWWRVSPSGVAAAACVAGAVAAVLGLAAILARLARAPLALGIAAASALVLAADLLAGGYLQRTGIPSYSAINGGRFYGLGNAGFAVLATGAVVTVGAAALRRGAQAWIMLLPVFLIVAAPVLGADIGGALTLGIVLAVGLWGQPRLLLAMTVGAVLAVALVEAQRSEPTHLGEFVDSLGDGTWTDTVSRKASAALSTLATFYPLLVAGSAAMLRRHPLLEPLVVLWVAGSVLNDSGIAVAAIGMAVAVPLYVATEP